MPPNSHQPDIEFAPAPAGNRVRIITAVTLPLIAVVLAVGIALTPLRGRHGVWPALIAPAFLVPMIAVFWLAARIRSYRLVGGTLVVDRALLTTRFPLAGLTEAVRDRDALQGAVKLYGNGGLGAIAGRFRSRRLGPFRAYVTDRENAVVLRWPERCLVVSPAQPGWFLDSVRRRAGLTSPR